jgi:hypothetical protein
MFCTKDQLKAIERVLLKAPKIKAAPESLHQRLDDTSFPRLSQHIFKKETIIKSAKQARLTQAMIACVKVSINSILVINSEPKRGDY